MSTLWNIVGGQLCRLRYRLSRRHRCAQRLCLVIVIFWTPWALLTLFYHRPNPESATEHKAVRIHSLTVARVLILPLLKYSIPLRVFVFFKI